MPTNDPFLSIDHDRLEAVAGGAARTPKGGDDAVLGVLNEITSSLKDLGSKNSGSDPMQMMLMMIMLGGMGGGGGGGYIAGPAAGPPVINVDTSVAGGGGCRRRGKKGW